MHNKDNNGRMSAILNLIEKNFFRVHPSMKSHIILFHNNGLALWQGFPDITHIIVNNT